MMQNFCIRKAEEKDIFILRSLILGLAEHERRPEDGTGTAEEMKYWLFERKIATALIAEFDGEAVGYAIYYPVYGSYSACGKIHLEDIFIKQEFRGKGLGTRFLSFICKQILSQGFKAMEWSALDFNTDSIEYYLNLGAQKENGRSYFDFSEEHIKSLAEKFHGTKF